MHLIAPLAGGIDGCESGTFSIVRRGTSTAASYYSDFEGLTAPIVGTNIPLDSRGGGVFYVNEMVKVTCKSAAGVTIREFIAGEEATCLDVRSDSFTGTHYQTGAVAAGNPITLKALLDKWNDSAGSVGLDWKVSIAGVATNLSTAFSSLQGQRRFVVTSYGAVGDGVTNDTSAINAAISAANAAGGGIVFFPPGNYVCTTVTAFSTVTLEGAGPGQTTISLQTASQFFINGTMVGVVRGIRFSFLGALGTVIGYINASSISSLIDYLIEDCVFINKSSLSGNAVVAFPSASTHKVTINRCNVEIGSSRGLSAGSGCNLRVLSSSIRAVDGSATAGVGIFTDVADLQVVMCDLDFSAISAGSVQAFSSGNGGATLAVGNRITPPATSVTAWTMFNHGGSRKLVEAGNSTASTTVNWSSSYKVYSTGAAGSQHGSRQGAYVNLTSNADPCPLPLGEAAVVRLRVTDASGWTANCSLSPDSALPGQQVVLMIWNDTAGALNFDFPGNFGPTIGTQAVAANSVRSWVFASMPDPGGNIDWFPVADIAGALSAE